MYHVGKLHANVGLHPISSFTEHQQTEIFAQVILDEVEHSLAMSIQYKAV